MKRQLQAAFLAFALAVLIGHAWTTYVPWSLHVMTLGSVPKGLYLATVYRGEPLAYDDIVCVRWQPPVQDRVIAKFPQGTQLCKYVAGLPGDRVTVRGRSYQVCRVDGDCVDVGGALETDAAGNPLAASTFSGTLPREHLWLASTRSARSFDSRYFGPVSRAFIVRRAKALLTW